MPIEPGALTVVLLYAGVLAVVLFVSPRIEAPGAPRPWWRSVRLWAAFVAVVQMIVYARWG